LGGDELLAGYPSFVDLPHWRRRFGGLARVPGLGLLARHVLGALAPRMKREHPKASSMFEHAGSWAGAYLLRRGLYMPHELSTALDRDLVREGLHRLNPLKRLSESLEPDPGSDVGRVCALESAQYLKNQLLRDADWAGMAHSLEIRVPLVDVETLKSLAPSLPGLKPGAGKAALAGAPSKPLPDEILARAKTGFGVPTGAWMKAVAEETSTGKRMSEPKGVVSRRWSQTVFGAATTAARRTASTHLAC
jgi:asparagine synthase (glutamine-hydrolysing)